MIRMLPNARFSMKRAEFLVTNGLGIASNRQLMID